MCGNFFTVFIFAYSCLAMFIGKSDALRMWRSYAMTIRRVIVVDVQLGLSILITLQAIGIKSINCLKLNGLLQHNVHFVFYSVSWVRSFLVWKWILNYFPIDLVKTADLPSDRNYLICVFPHGILR